MDKEYHQTPINEESELEKYKKNLHNLVVAYKKLTLEKNALEATLKTSVRLDIQDDTSETDVSEISNDSHHSRFINLVNTIDILQRDKNEIIEKSKEEKNILLTEKQELEQSIKELNMKMDTLKKLQRLEMENIKSKFNKERLQREKEFNDHGVMMKELQKLMSEERKQKEHAESTADLLQKEVVRLKRDAELFKKQSFDLNTELHEIKQELKNKDEETSNLLTQLRQEVKSVRQNHSVAISQEQTRANEAENRSRELAIAHEIRVSNLEMQLAELSNSIGVYEKIRQQDEETIKTLKDQIKKLEKINHNEIDYSVSEIVEKFKYFKTLLLNLARTSEVPLSIEDIFLKDLDFSIFGNKFKYRNNIEEQKESNAIKELPHLPDNYILLNQIKNLKQQVSILQSERDLLEKKYKDKIEEDTDESLSWKEKYIKNDLDWQKRVSFLEQQLLRQRDKAQEMVSEKEQELNSLRELLQNTKINRKFSHSSTGSRKEFQEYIDDETTKKGSHLLHYAHELALKDMEICKFRKSKSKLESKYRDLQKSTADMQHQFKFDIDRLNQELRRLETCKTREGANLEYLKNVTLSYFLTADDKIRRHLVNAIAAVLKFSDSETQKALKSLT
ncbi:GRIP and coiled-coil domain-containing protein 1 [Daktulosphaira vitifoliae]|uniref:GRIP and coiled-coil domain-containing protein 1 n=1 Tax=Daktulosphaira vitifoliae TaxID=58002 RepID=UPI0021AAB582|nr:GRIP and coiled-coil domain-containing protein 1 [Daktulosphaira vitifoliae]